MKHRILKHVKKHHKLLLVVGIFFILGIFSVSFFIRSNNLVKADPWFDVAWTQQVAVTVDNSSNAGVLTNYQVSTTLNTAELVTANLMRSDCGDLRVTDSDRITSIDFWVVDGTCNTTATQIWTKVPSVPASSTTSIYLYYGNAAATSISSWDNTILPYSDTQLTSNFGSPRYSGGLLNYDGKLWIFGGRINGNGTGSRVNDVWSSTDGVSWSQIAASSSWGARSDFGHLVFNNKMWILGGLMDGTTRKNDVWSSTDGITWTEETASANWGIRAQFGYTVFNNKMWIMGGTNGVKLNDVWSSTDGITWTEETASANWGIRTFFPAITFNNKMWILGGSGVTALNDVWSSSDGITWTQETAAAAWSIRNSLVAVVLDNKIWIAGGFGSSVYKNDLWYSSDGITWTNAITSAGWHGRSSLNMVVWNDKLIVAYGQYFSGSSVFLTDVWQMMRTYTAPAPAITVVSDTTAPTVPGSPSSTTPTTDTTPTWTWSASMDSGTGLASPAYTVEWATDTGFTTDFSSTTASTNTFTHSSTLANGTWYFRVKASDIRSNVSTYSTTGSVIVDTTVPTVPGLPSTTNPTSDNTPTWSWDASTDTGSGLATPAYTVEWATDTGFTTDFNSTTSSTNTFTHVSTLADGTWYVRVKASDILSNTSSYSATGSVLIDVTAPSVPGLPSTTTPTSDNTPSWVWTASSDAGSGLATPAYTVEWATNTGFTTNFNSSTSNTNTFTHSSSLADGTWYVRVKASDILSNTSSYSATGSVLIDVTAPSLGGPPESPGLPSTTTPTVNTTPTWAWSASIDTGAGLATPAYTVEWATDTGFITDFDSSNASSNTFTHTTLLTDGTWYFRVKASDILSNTSSYSATGSVLIDTAAPSVPGTPSTTTPTTDTTPAWIWTASSDAGAGLASPAYTVEWATDTGFTTDFNSTTSSTNSFTHVSTLADGTWYVRVKASDILSNVSSYSATESVLIDTTVPSSVGAPAFGTITVNSITLEKPVTVTESGSGLNQWQVRRNGTTELGFTPVLTTTFTDSPLSENTQYTYDVQFNDVVNNLGLYGTSASKYTLANTPSHFATRSVGRSSISLLVDAFPNDTSGVSGYYFSRTGNNSGWIQINTWQDTSVVCGTTYDYSVKFRNGDGTETGTVSLSQATVVCESRGSSDTPVVLPFIPLPSTPVEQPVLLPPSVPTPISSYQPNTTMEKALIKYPNDPDVYLIENGAKRLILSVVDLLNLGFLLQDIIIISPVSTFPNGPVLIAPLLARDLKNGSLIKYPFNPKMYVLENGQKRLISSPQDFLQLGFAWGDVLTLPTSQSFPDGARKEVVQKMETPYVFTKNISIGSNGPDVLALQEKLQSLGFFPSNIVPNGNYGPVTVASVKAFQSANDLDPVGQVGPLTKIVLNKS